ncbi:MAG: ABC transporter ATP-binding protein [Saprospiraceae bacterium]|nr:ABC transporter ATP-binding protein [Saprospiraceae bacterium]
MSYPAISIENLTKYYGSFRAVNSVSFTVDSGEIFGFLGPNGAGKTTCIKMMLDLLRPTNGKIRIFGKQVTGNSIEIRNSIGYLPGNFTNFDNMTAIEFLKFMAYQRGIKFMHPVKLCSDFELGNSDLRKKMKSMSHGMLQKIGIIQAVFHNPQLLILDEPTSGLDPLMQDVFYELIKELHKSGVTIFFSSHNLAEVERICNNIAVIRAGEIVALETLDNLKKSLFRKLNVKLKHQIDGLKLNNAELISRDGLNYTFLIRGSSELLVKELSKLPIDDFSFPEPGLDEIFISYYNSDQKKIDVL